MGWHEISESEKPRYLESRARQLADSYGGDVGQAAEALCAIWGWDPKRYPIKDDSEREPEPVTP